MYLAFCLVLACHHVLAADVALDEAAEMVQDTSAESALLPGAIQIEGDKLDLQMDRKMRAVGNAVIHKDNQHIYGDSIEYDLQNDELQVNGNARIEAGKANLSGPSLKMRLSDNIGEMNDASIAFNKKTELPLNPPAKAVQAQSILLNDQITQIHNPKTYVDNNRDADANYTPQNKSLEGSRGDAGTILFEGQDKKRLKNARYTTCEAGNDDWYIKAKELELDDYTESGVAKNAHIEFKGVPLLYTPWLSFSFNNQRKSGLLAPTLGTTSRSGFEVLTPFYWNIRPDMDATLATRYLSKRGLQLQGEFRYLDEDYSGVNNLEFLNKDSLSNDNRYYANFTHRHNFGSGWSAGYNIEKVSDDQYFSEMSTRIVSTSRVNLPQEGRIDYADDVWEFNLLAQRYQTLDNRSFPYQRLPQLSLAANKEWGMFDTNLQTQWAYFDKDNDAPKSATGSRFTAYPSISMPLAKSYGFITPKLGVHYSNYQLNDNDFVIGGNTISNNNASRTLPIFSLDGGLYFDRDASYKKNKYTQTIEPRLYYVYIPEKNQSQIPIFDSALSDLNLTSLFSENQFTGSDRINHANQLSLAMTTRLIDDDSGAERVTATLGQRFYFNDQTTVMPGTPLTDRRSSDVIGALTARLSSKWNLDSFWQYNPDSTSMIRSNMLVRYNPEPGKLLNIGYRYTQDFLEQINLSGQWPIARGWYGVGRYNYSLRDKNLIESLAGLEYDAGCWQARTVIQRVETATADANYGLFFQLELGGLASIGSNPLNLLRRDIPGYLSSGEIPNFYRQQNFQR